MYALNGKIAKRNGNFLTRSFNTLNFGVEGSKFPDYTAEKTEPLASLSFYSDTPNSVEVNFGDGVVINYEFIPVVLGSGYAIIFRNSRPHNHVYQDSNTGERIVSFKFLKPLEITKIRFSRMKLIGTFPRDVVKLKKLQSIIIYQSSSPSAITSFPINLNKLYFLRELILNNIGFALDNGIPDAFLGLNLETLILSNSTDLSNPQTSNFNKINIFQNTLRFLGLEGTKIDEIPQEFEELNLEDLAIGKNLFTIIPNEINSQVNLTVLDLSYITNNIGLESYGDISNLVNLENILARLQFNISTEIPAYFSNFTKLKVFSFESSFRTQERLDAAITSMYDFVNLNASMVAGNTKFREMVLTYSGVFSATPSGIYQQPDNYVQGINNGDPISPLEMIWVLEKQYEHVITYE